MNARTKIVATLGPASDPPDVLDAMLLAGVDVVRLNLSHGHLDEHIARLQRGARGGDANRLGRCRARGSAWPEGARRAVPGWRPRAARPGRRSRWSPTATSSSCDVIGVDYETLREDLHCGDRVVIGDGAITLGVEQITPPGVECLVRSGGHAQGRPGVHLPSERLRFQTPTTRGPGAGRGHGRRRVPTSSRSRSYEAPTTCTRCATPSPR